MADSLLEDNQDATKIVALAMKDVTDYSKYVKYIYTLEEVDGELLLVGYNFQAGE